MTRALNAVAGLIMLAIVGGIAGAAYLIYRLAENTVQTIDRTWGPAFYQIGAGGALLAFLVLVIGGAVIAVQWMARRSRQIGARDGLYPIMDAGRGNYSNINEPGAQSLAVLAAGRRPTAALAGRVIDAQYRPAPEQVALPESEPAGHYPARAEIYSAPMPRSLALPVGVDGAGRPVALPLRNLGNVLVGGLPGGGKSELLASMMAGLLRQDATGRRVQIAAVDTKLVSFGPMPHVAALYARPALTVEDAHGLVAELVAEVQRRFELLYSHRVRTVEELEASAGERMPYLVAFVDELADLTTDADSKRAARFLAMAQEIGRKGRAAGVGLVLATQRPGADVIPSSLRNLAGAAVAFRVGRNHDSITILGDPGAELLPAIPGRCLVKHADTVTVQGYWAGLEGKRFDQFCASLPQAAGSIEARGWPIRGNVTEAVITGLDGPERATTGDITPWDSTDQRDYTPEQVERIRALYADMGSLRAVQRELYQQVGGYWFYRIRDVVQGDNDHVAKD